MSVYDRPVEQRNMWTRWVNLLAGILLAISPWILGYSDNTTAMWTNLILGVLIALFSLIGLFARNAGEWPQWANVVLGVAAIIAPFVLAFSDLAGALWSGVVLGAIVAILAAVGIFSRQRSAV